MITAATAALKVAEGVLAGANAVVQGPVYKLAEGAITIAQDALTAANKVADAELKVASASLDAAKFSAQAAINTAEKAVEAAKIVSEELRVFNIAQGALDAFYKTKAGVLDEVQKLALTLENCAEKVKFDLTKAALAIASSATKELDAASEILKGLEGSLNVVSEIGTWLVNEVGNLINITKVKVSGSLHDKTEPNHPLTIEIAGKFCDGDLNWKGDFVPGHGEQLVKDMMKDILKDAGNEITKYVHKKL